MFKTLRINAGMTRQDLSHSTGRSVNYLLKAEQLTFPSPPLALIEYWAKRNPEEVDRFTLEAAYYAEQRKHRREWLNHWIPRPSDTKHFTFCRKWISVTEQEETVCPSQYAVSTGLCVPASAVYFAEKYPEKPVAASIKAAVDDLLAYAQSGEFYSDRVYAVGTHNIVRDLLRLRSEL